MVGWDVDMLQGLVLKLLITLELEEITQCNVSKKGLKFSHYSEAKLINGTAGKSY